MKLSTRRKNKGELFSRTKENRYPVPFFSPETRGPSTPSSLLERDAKTGNLQVSGDGQRIKLERKEGKKIILRNYKNIAPSVLAPRGPELARRR